MKKPKTYKQAVQMKENWSARGSKCPICNREFRYSCKHDIAQAYAKLEENVLEAKVNEMLKKLSIDSKNYE